MGIFVIFWSAIFAIFFFVLGIFFKALAATLAALDSTLKDLLPITGIAVFSGIGLYLLYAIVDGIITEGIVSVLGMIASLAIVLLIVFAIFGGLATGLTELIIYLILLAIDTVEMCLETMAFLCESGYAKFVMIMIKRLANN